MHYCNNYNLNLIFKYGFLNLYRELNELRKPSSDNPDILRFFKYMRAAKDGQDMVDCEAAFKECTSLKDSDNPVMITTYNDINKLVQARKLW